MKLSRLHDVSRRCGSTRGVRAALTAPRSEAWRNWHGGMFVSPPRRPAAYNDQPVFAHGFLVPARAALTPHRGNPARLAALIGRAFYRTIISAGGIFDGGGPRRAGWYPSASSPSTAGRDLRGSPSPAIVRIYEADTQWASVATRSMR
jgi:hypothetical protein